jgi:hypothetical protein
VARCGHRPRKQATLGYGVDDILDIEKTRVGQKIFN